MNSTTEINYDEILTALNTLNDYRRENFEEPLSHEQYARWYAAQTWEMNSDNGTREYIREQREVVRAETLRLLAIAVRAEQDGYMVKATDAHNIGVSSKIPQEALASRRVGGGFVGTAERYRYQYLFKKQ
jgi:hypothetical protein